ncbi:ATP-dependent DNA ligase [Microbacterium sp. cx-59]|uniref:ATP-dependent DNA ligase n=1 Tax=Microbacterium sp. cx-59 TaxID=2891207 RepID=UPI001E28E6B2|nr:ATP-dependent DNA ligase [Microbacterium sp. cx-59]MCC4906918.1 ATP-dependent DNA ligase [Microbacterium sp. cx-59]
MATQEQTVTIEGRRLRLSRLDKVLYPATGTTKAEVIDYYARIAPLILPHLDGRPVTRKRWPDGVGDADAAEPISFFAKDLERGTPDWIPRTGITHSTGLKHYPLVSDVPTLVWLAQTASLELHTPQWRFTADDEPGAPDRLVLDLDPGPGVGLRECAEVARLARRILDDIGLAPLPVTSGSKGIHLYAALPPGHTSEQASALAKELGRSLEADHPDLVVSTMSKSARPGRVFVDWSQNNGKKTTVAPYSLRGRARPMVAVPRTWDELDDPDLAHLDMAAVLERAGTLGDPLAALGFRDGQRAGERAPLRTYLAKRSADRTPEPVPDHPRAEGSLPIGDPRFVIQEHHARRLHYDLRLERDGVFVSWAVPKGVPEATDRNHLAVMTEDHPLSYGTFEGTIPAGEYGAGTVEIWDAGTYELEKWRDDEVIFTLIGRESGPLGRARLALIRTDGSGEKSTWLLHRMKTDAAAAAPLVPTREAPASTTPASVAPPWPDALSPGRLRPMLAENGSPAAARSSAGRWSSEWAEIKWDGIRALAFWDGTRMRMRARSGTDITDRYPEITGAAAILGPHPVVLDGEVVAFDAGGRPSFTLLQNRMHLTKAAEIRAQVAATPVRFHVFDLLAEGGEDLTGRPLRERRGRLDALLAEGDPVLTAPPAFDDVDAALAASAAFHLEGIVVKNPDGRYRPGERSADWIKVKHVRTQEVVIGGVRPGHGGRSGSIGSLLMGIPTPEGLHYVGRVGSGFSERLLATLAERLAALRTDDTSFIDVPDADAADAWWVRPELVGEVAYAEVTPDGRLRHARWRGVRSDKSANDVHDES